MSEDLPREEVLAKVDAFVAQLLRAAGVEGPPVDAILLAQRHLGMTICLDRRQPSRGRAQRTGGKSQIFLKPEPTAERHQWTVAHEIGEHLKVQLLERLGIDPAETRAMAGESLANLFAHRLLVPACWFGSDAALLGYDVLELKQRYSTSSHEVIALRNARLAGAGDHHDCGQRQHLPPPQQRLAGAQGVGANRSASVSAM